MASQRTLNSTIHIVVAYTSGKGHAARLARHVAAGAESVEGTEVSLLDVADLTDELWATLARADAMECGFAVLMAFFSSSAFLPTNGFRFEVVLDQQAGNADQGQTADATYSWDSIQLDANTFNQ